MEWVEVVKKHARWWELRDGSALLAEAWTCALGTLWSIGWNHVPAESIDDAKDAAWAAVYRSTR